MQALSPEPPQAAIIVTGRALPEAKAELVYAVSRIGRRQIEQSLGSDASSPRRQRLEPSSARPLWQCPQLEAAAEAARCRSSGSTARHRSIIRATGAAQTSRNALIPLSRNT